MNAKKKNIIPKIIPINESSTNSEKSKLPFLNPIKKLVVNDIKTEKIIKKEIEINICIEKTAVDIINKLQENYSNLCVKGFKLNNKPYNKETDAFLKSSCIFSRLENPISIDLIFEKPRPPQTQPFNQSPHRKTPLKHKKDEFDFECDQYTLTFIDYSKSMSCLFDKELKISEVAIDIIRNFAQTRFDFLISDPTFYFDNEKNSFQPINVKSFNYPLDLFNSSTSTVFNAIKNAIKSLKEKPITCPKQIFLISDCVGDSIELEQIIDICNALLSENITLDVLILQNSDKFTKNSETKLLNNLCAISHITGGIFFFSRSKEDSIEFSEHELLIDISKRHLPKYKYRYQINQNIFENVSKNIQFRVLSETFKKDRSCFYNDMELYSPDAEIKIEFEPENKKIKEQIEICFFYQNQQIENDEEQLFSIYYLYDEASNRIDSRKAIVFIIGQNNNKKIVNQILICFPKDYPKNNPSFFMLSDIKFDCCKSNGFINFEVNEDNKSLLQMLYDISQKLISFEKIKYRNNFLDPVDCLEQIDSMFHIFYGKKQKLIFVNPAKLKICK